MLELDTKTGEQKTEQNENPVQGQSQSGRLLAAGMPSAFICPCHPMTHLQLLHTLDFCSTLLRKKYWLCGLPGGGGGEMAKQRE